MPVDAVLAREPTPVDDVDALISARSVHSRDSCGSMGQGQGPGLGHSGGIGGIGGISLLRSPSFQQQAENAHNILESAGAGAGAGAGRSADKPKLYMCVPGDNANDYAWQALGVYDDDDLDDTTLLLLHCQKGPHMLWVGQDFDADHKKLCGDPEGLLDWACHQVQAGENALWVDVFPCDVCLQRSGEEDNDFWDAFQDGF